MKIFNALLDTNIFCLGPSSTGPVTSSMRTDNATNLCACKAGLTVVTVKNLDLNSGERTPQVSSRLRNPDSTTLWVPSPPGSVFPPTSACQHVVALKRKKATPAQLSTNNTIWLGIDHAILAAGCKFSVFVDSLSFESHRNVSKMIAPRGLAFAVAGILLHGVSSSPCRLSSVTSSATSSATGATTLSWASGTSTGATTLSVSTLSKSTLSETTSSATLSEPTGSTAIFESTASTTTSEDTASTTAESTGSTATSETTITITASETTGTTAISESAGTTTTSEATGPVSSTVTTSASSTFLTTTAAPTTTTATSAPATTKTIYTRGISPERRDNDAASAAALPHGVEIQEEDYRLTIHIEDEHDVPSIVEESQDKFDHSQPAVLSYSWALTDNQGFGADGVCSVISKADGIVVDTLDFGRGPAYRYRTRSVDVKLPSENPVFSMEFSCAGEGALGVDVLIQEVTLVAAPSNDGELRRA
ncbi:hypothetical protein ACJZ2D_005037 [Fusarium nematophilum]